MSDRVVGDLGAGITAIDRLETPEGARPAASAARGTRWLADLPDRVIVLFLCLAFAAGPLATFGQFHRVPVLVVFALLVVVTSRIRLLRFGHGRADVLGAAVALVLVIVWVVANVPLASQYFIVVRDPAVYTLRALWLSHHASPNLPITETLQGVHGVSNTYVETDGFYQHGALWEPQGPTMVPALLALGGWIAGQSGVLAANVVIGGVALLTVYALGRRVLGPLWALVPMTALALSLPMLAFSRSPYTEPAALVLGLGGIVLLWNGMAQRRKSLVVLGGLSLGATFLTRTDGLLFVLGATVALGLASALARSTQLRVRLRGDLVLFLTGAAVSLALGYVDLARNSAPYEATSWGQIKPLSEVMVVAVLVSVALTYVPGMRGVRSWFASERVRLAFATTGVVGLAFCYLAFRPLFYTAHSSPNSPAVTEIGLRQEAANLPVDGTRTYDEFTVHWLAWYFSWPVVILAAIGVAMMIVRTWIRRDRSMMVLLGVLGVGSALYLNHSLITPDQIWAMRRYLPIVVPLGLVLAVAVPAWIARRYPRVAALAVLAGVLIAIVPITTWRGVVAARQYEGAAAFTDQLCAQVSDNHLVIADKGNGGAIFLPTLRVRCGVQAALLSNPSQQTLLQVRQNWDDGRPIVVLAFVQDAVPWRTAPTGPTVVGRMSLWAEPLTSRPTTTQTRVIPTWFGDLDDDGSVTPRSP